MADWVVISSLATAGGTLGLAVATFAAVRSGDRSSRIAERALLLGLRPVLVPSREGDPAEEAPFGDDYVLRVSGGIGAAEAAGERIYLALPLRNVGPGLAVIHGWQVSADVVSPSDPHTGTDDFRLQQRDLYVPAGDTSFWQGAIRDPEDPAIAGVRGAIDQRHTLSVDLLYGDWEGGQRTISRFVLRWEDDAWAVDVLRHWSVEGADPRPRV
jgi:hypothetical protein